MAVVESETTGHVVLYPVSWPTYKALVAEVDCPGTRFTYDRGTLEIRSPSYRHERFKKLLCRMIHTLTEELWIPIRSDGSTTWMSDARQQGLEPDECYYVANEPRVRGRKEIDLAVDPPPDLAVEVEISARSIDKMPLYAALGVPEIWRYDGKTLQVEQLQPDGTYARRDRSTAFPFLPLEELARFLDRRDTTDETTWIRSFRTWVQGIRESRSGSE